MRRSLPVASAGSEGLGLVTIMDRTLATELGAPYVKLAAFAIDVDRARIAIEDASGDGEEEEWPFGWEVFLTEEAMLRACAEVSEPVEFLDAISASVFARSPDGPMLGSQLVFAVYDAMTRGALPDGLRATFLHWKKRPTELVQSLAAFWSDRDAWLAKLSHAALDVPLDPAFAPTTRALLTRFLG